MMITQELIEHARANVKKHGWAQDVARVAVEEAAPWLAMSDEEAWGLMFGPRLTRSWMVWSNGHCPACRKDVPMYNWKIDALSLRWKVACPHCAVRFPTNDFEKFHQSGLDPRGVFDPQRADRSLLFNADHPDPAHPLHTFGVDDGDGFVSEGNRWRFIATYLIYGQWKQIIVRGTTRLAAAYSLTGDAAYARKAMILLDRVADVHPGFDHRRQSWVYEKTGDEINCDGFVSTWHDCCEETRELALAYGQVRDASHDPALVAFLREKAARYTPEMPKNSGAEVCANIEAHIFREALAHPEKIRSNYPRAEISKAIMHIELDTPEDRAKADVIIDALVANSIKVDGVTGEKGLAGYSAGVIQGLAMFLAQLENRAPGTLKQLLAKHPGLARTYRFHIDTWSQQKYYPLIGDTGQFAGQFTHYVGAGFTKKPSLLGSMFTLFWQLYEATGDAGYVQVLYLMNGGTLEGLPYDLFVDEPAAMQRRIAEVIRTHGEEPIVGSINFTQWHLAMIRSGSGRHARTLWVDYDSGGPHGHSDAMNIGLFARGLDLMPDMGYPPVQFGGWNSDRAAWYTLTGAHNTVLVDGRNQTHDYRKPSDGQSPLWAMGKTCRVVRVSDPAMNMAAQDAQKPTPQQYERTLAMVDVSEEDFYIIDVFRVVGGGDHVKFQHSHFAELETHGLTLTKCETPFEDKRFQMRGFKVDPLPGAGWSAQWRALDEYKFLSPGEDVCLRYTDLTRGAAAYTCEMWVTKGIFDSTTEAWVPRIFTRRMATGDSPLASTFVSVIEPSGATSKIQSIRRLTLHDAEGRERHDGDVAVEVTLTDGRRDLIVCMDVQDVLSRGTPGGAMVSDGWDVPARREFSFLRVGRDGQRAESFEA